MRSVRAGKGPYPLERAPFEWGEACTRPGERCTCPGEVCTCPGKACTCPGKASPHPGERFFCPNGRPPEWGRAPYGSYARRTARTGAFPTRSALLPATPGVGQALSPGQRTGELRHRTLGNPKRTSRTPGTTSRRLFHVLDEPGGRQTHSPGASALGLGTSAPSPLHPGAPSGAAGGPWDETPGGQVHRSGSRAHALNRVCRPGSKSGVHAVVHPGLTRLATSLTALRAKQRLEMKFRDMTLTIWGAWNLPGLPSKVKSVLPLPNRLRAFRARIDGGEGTGVR